MIEFLDTQIISYAMKGRYEETIAGKVISSTVAKEFLLLQGASPTQAVYYIPFLGGQHELMAMKEVTRGRKRPFNRMQTDAVLIDLGPDYGAVVEYSDIAISNVINERDARLFDVATNFLGKDQQRVLKKRLAFLLRNQIRCVTLSRSAVVKTLDLLGEFEKSHNPKANFRNTLNDLMIVASVLDSSGRLTTVDSELVRFVARYQECVLSQRGEFVTIDFDTPAPSKRRSSAESKGYMNRGWQVRFRRYGHR